MRELIPSHRPALVLAPMQDVTQLPFIKVLAKRSLPDWFVTEYFRVHPDSKLNKHLLRAITENETNRPVFAQMIGDDLPSLIRAAGELADYPIEGIDLNLGCPAPIVCRKNAGGGLLRDPERLKHLLTALRAAIPGRFTVKTRLGFAESGEFSALLEIFQGIGLDGLTIHARTVKQGYQGAVATDRVREAVGVMDCPVVANGNIVDVTTGRAYHALTGAAGLMVGRGAIRNPWVFAQLAAAWEGGPQNIPTHRNLLVYIEDLYAELAASAERFCPNGHVQRMKRTVGYISHGLGVDFEYEIRRCRTPDEFWAICRAHLDHDGPLPVRPPEDSGLFSGFTALLGG
ncbi:MAG: tRNA-dihydrouridine synthase family protein [Akkermansiaceae bacterium]|nr:tRNA-dihydrouridine synthase family protein [Akkermansiaceae bacterium]MCF7730879.1 tRNA-dihydrouridine synthase family protein [Akkermansiaceae bacterium]